MIRRLIVGFLGVMLILMTACHHQAAQVQGGTKQEIYEKMESTISPSPDYPNINIESKIRESEKFQYAIHYPMIESESWNKEMKRWSNEKIEHFKSEIDELLPVDEAWRYELHIDFEILDVSESFISVKFNESRFFGGAHTEEEIFTYNYDREEEQFIELQDLFKEKSKYLDLISDQAFNKLMELPEMQELVWDDHFQEGIDPIQENFAHFVINEGKLVIFFERYQVGPNSVGSPQIEFTEEELQSELNNQYRNYFSKEDLEQVDNEEAKELVTIEQDEDVAPLDPNKKHVAITFDDGPHETVTPRVLDTLAENDVKASFFLLGNRVEYHPEIVAKIKNDGHEIGNHSWSHPQLTNLSEEEVKAQVNNTSAEIEKITGDPVQLMRPPYGVVNELTKQYIDYPIINWSVDPEDWRNRDADAVLKKVKEQVHDGAIILMHDIYPSTADAVEHLIPWLISEGYEIVTVSQLLEFDVNEEAIEVGKIYRSK